MYLLSFIFKTPENLLDSEYLRHEWERNDAIIHLGDEHTYIYGYVNGYCLNAAPYWDEEGRWIIYEVNEKYKLGNRNTSASCFIRGNVSFLGNRIDSMNFLRKVGCTDHPLVGEINNTFQCNEKGEGVAYAEDGGLAISGYGGISYAGKGGKAVSGDNGISVTKDFGESFSGRMGIP